METNSTVRILTLSDQVVDRIYSKYIRKMFPDIDLIISCGDLPYYYLEYILDMLNVPMLFVHGNHDPEVEISSHGTRKYPWGAVNMHRKCLNHNGLLIVGFEGSIRYSDHLHQYSQREVWMHTLSMVPRLLWNRLVHGRYLDILMTHSPAFGLGDRPDRAHVGFKAYRWLIETFKPRYHIHGHIHVYDRNSCMKLNHQETIVMNTCDYKRMEITVRGKNV